MEYLKNITRFGLNFTFWRMFWDRRVRSTGGIPTGLCRYWCFFVLFYIVIRLLHLIIFIIMRVLIALAAQPVSGVDHSKPRVLTVPVGIKRNKVSERFEIVSVSRMHLSATFLCVYQSRKFNEKIL